MFDPQSEGSRADWLAELCLAAGIEREVVAQPLPEDSRDREQRAALLKELALRRVDGAREALYATFGPSPHSSFYALSEIIQLDRDAGLLFTARELGKRVLADPDFSVDGSDFWAFDASRADGAALALLVAESSRDPHIRACVQSIERETARESTRASRRSRPLAPIEEVLAEIRGAHEKQRLDSVPRRGRQATREELQRVVDLLFELEAPRPLHHALWFLGMSTMVPLHPRIFELTRHDDDQVRYWAARVLSKHSLHGVRTCGLEALARGDLVVALEILTRSAQVDDIETLVAALQPLEAPQKEHAVGSGLLDILEHSPEAGDARLALHVYERTPCMYCREKAVRWLCNHAALPVWAAEECVHDGSDDIRALVEAGR